MHFFYAVLQSAGQTVLQKEQTGNVKKQEKQKNLKKQELRKKKGETL